MGGACEALTIDEIITINRRMLEMFGGLNPPALLNRGSLEHILEAIIFPVFGQQLYPSIYDKAAALCHTLARGHVFQDGNKRTALEASRQFLELNGLKLNMEPAAVIKLIVSVAEGKTKFEDLVEWLRYNTTRL